MKSSLFSNTKKSVDTLPYLTKFSIDTSFVSDLLEKNDFLNGGILKRKLLNEDSENAKIALSHIWSLIASYLDPSSIILFTKVCKLFYNLIHSDNQQLKELRHFKSSEEIKRIFKKSDEFLNEIKSNQESISKKFKIPEIQFNIRLEKTFTSDYLNSRDYLG